jgi:hypothetical protein
MPRHAQGIYSVRIFRTVLPDPCERARGGYVEDLASHLGKLTMAQQEHCRPAAVAPPREHVLTAWAWVWSLVVAIGVGISMLAWGPVTTLVTVTVLGALGCMVQALMQSELPTRKPDWELRTCRALFSAAAVVSFVVLCQGVPEVALPLLALGVLSHPRVLRLARGSRTAAPERTDLPVSAPADETVHPLPGPTQAGRLTDEELCLAWRRSFLSLERARTSVALQDVVRLRQAYLDELARRHPSGLQAWFDSGARAAGGPDRYLHGRSPHPPSP